MWAKLGPMTHSHTAGEPYGSHIYSSTSPESIQGIVFSQRNGCVSFLASSPNENKNKDNWVVRFSKG
jgi:hypothetical protein